ncbi:Disulfide bond formation protein DsbB [Pseudooceanicola antarcticus]|uniref:Disulfide bond formation protein B n=1 Tax=Pseudooceanicola antarcticus TaxID=1247613 RepID=A0A285J5R6_9RHOB|nr:disulfide bond formation protein B [Pseudooceanicola antarcticus]PJE26861.1 disulfide bond formation protein B [Pseudooceanicola antarcticus]SNY55552.1 Disulfide bond formation protein DsbB [Pseudooceanicola antarcticus]
MTFRLKTALAGAGSAALLLGALGSQFIGGLAPCHLCLLQRWPHLAAIVIAGAAVATGQRLLALLGALAAAVTAGIGIYHTGVERDIFEGPTSCTSSSTGSVSADQLFDQIMAAPLIRCDEVAFEFLGLSMASWNAVLSLGLVAVWLWAYLRD